MSPLSLSLSGLDRAWAARLRADVTFAAALGLAADASRLQRGWPKEMLAKPSQSALPLVTFYVIDRERVGNDAPTYIMIASDVWDWHSMVYLDDIDEAMMQALAGEAGCASWYDTARGIYVSCSMEDGSDPQDVLPRRRRVWKVAPA